MSQSLPSYPDYKPAGLPWLEEVPAHWEVKRAKHVFRTIDQRSATGLEEKLTVSSKSGVVPRREQKVTMFMAASYVGHKLCWPGDLVVNSLWAWANGLGFAKHHGIISTAYSVYRPLPEYAEAGPYLDYLLRSSAFQWEFQVGSKGIWISRLQLTDDTFMRMPIVLPPLPEQQRIVAFLDSKTRQIARLLRHKRQLIKLLNEQKQALIHRAVTQGLDAAAPRKESGVAWLGEVPAHWEVVKLKRVCRVQGGYAFAAESFGSQGVAVIRMSNLRRGFLDLTDVVRVPVGNCVNAFTLNAGDILYGLSGSIGATGSLGNFAVVRDKDLPAQLNQRVGRFRPNVTVLSAPFLVQIIQTPVFYEQILAETTGTAQFNVSTSDIENAVISLPSLHEQAQIVKYIQLETNLIDQTISRAQREIELIQEYRTRLIADVVTGRVDVRQLAVAASGGEVVEDLLDEETGEEELAEETVGTDD